MCLRIVGPVRVSSRCRRRRLVGIHLNQPCFLKRGVQSRNVAPLEFFPASKQIVQRAFELLKGSRSLCCGCSVSAVSNGEQSTKVLIQSGEVFRLFATGRNAKK